jgi:hypothetical protein
LISTSDVRRFKSVYIESINEDLKYFDDTNEINFIDKEVCKIPKLEIIGHAKSKYKPKCKTKVEWGILENYTWNLNQRIASEFQSIFCNFREIERVDDFDIKLGAWKKLRDKQSVIDEVIEVKCTAVIDNKTIEYNNLFAQIVKRPPNSNRDQKASDNCKPLNVLLLSYDSVSRASWIKRLPKVTNFVLSEKQFILLNGYNIIGK